MKVFIPAAATVTPAIPLVAATTAVEAPVELCRSAAQTFAPVSVMQYESMRAQARTQTLPTM